MAESAVPSDVKFGCLDQRGAGQTVEVEDGFVGRATLAPYRRVRDLSVGPTWTYERKVQS